MNAVELQREIDAERRACEQVVAALDRVAEFAVQHRMERYVDDNAGGLLELWRAALERQLGRSLAGGRTDRSGALGVALCLAVFDRDGYRCKHCGTQRRLSVDHITPRSRGGSDDIENLQTLCRSCNSAKGAR